MDRMKTVLTNILGLLIFALLVYAVFKGFMWFIGLFSLSPKGLAVASLAVILIPVSATLLLAASSKDAFNSGPAALSIMALPIGALGLLISGVWYLLGKLF